MMLEMNEFSIRIFIIQLNLILVTVFLSFQRYERMVGWIRNQKQKQINKTVNGYRISHGVSSMNAMYFKVETDLSIGNELILGRKTLENIYSRNLTCSRNPMHSNTLLN